LKPWRDGWRHLRFMLLFSPRWLFLIPGFVMFIAGLDLAAALSITEISLGRITLNVGTLMMSCMLAIVGFQLVALAFFTKIFTIAEGLLPNDARLSRVLKFLTLEKALLVSAGVLVVGGILLLRAFWLWGKVHFGQLPSMEDNLRRVIPAATLMVLGVQGIFSSFFMSALGLKTKTRKPPGL
jgi:hypothetical protein